MKKNELGHRARKRFGQNFLHDDNIINQIVSAIHPLASEKIVEIGPGLGAITTKILQATDQIDVIELDRDIIPKLIKNCNNHPNLTVHQADALKFDIGQICTKTSPKVRVIGNLPYNISTPILFHLFSSIEHIEDMHFMLQKEVVQRMAANPGNKKWGRLSIMVQYYCQVESLFLVPPHAFRPAPKVDSAIVRLTPYTTPPHSVIDKALMEKIVVNAFSQRRKTLRNALKKWLSIEDFEHLQIDPKWRPEQLSVEAFVNIANYLHHKSQN